MSVGSIGSVQSTSWEPAELGPEPLPAARAIDGPVAIADGVDGPRGEGTASVAGASGPGDGVDAPEGPSRNPAPVSADLRAEGPGRPAGPTAPNRAEAPARESAPGAADGVNPLGTARRTQEPNRFETFVIDAPRSPFVPWQPPDVNADDLRRARRAQDAETRDQSADTLEAWAFARTLSELAFAQGQSPALRA